MTAFVLPYVSTPSRGRRRAPRILYSRELPGGGYVTIQTESIDDASFHGWVSVERRSDRNRRDSTNMPVIAETWGPSPDSVYITLHKIAADNVAVAQAIRDWDLEHPAKSKM